MGNLLVTLQQLGTLSGTTLRPINKQTEQDEDQHGDDPGELPGPGGPRLRQVLPGGEEREQVCGRRSFLQVRCFLRKPHLKEETHLDRSSSRRSEESEKQGRSGRNSGS